MRPTTIAGSVPSGAEEPQASASMGTDGCHYPHPPGSLSPTARPRAAIHIALLREILERLDSSTRLKPVASSEVFL
ncbi:MAG: hypothetical protein ACE5OY_01710 [Candidatus Bathyarchaeia archaeon]